MSQENSHFGQLSSGFRRLIDQLTASDVIKKNATELYVPLEKLGSLLDVSKLYGKTIKDVTDEVRQQLSELGRCIDECHNSTEDSSIANAIVNAVKEKLENISIENFNYLILP